ncbi:hypothetical protein CYMTET_34546, partial [Cymbomonas tetramitiformis]
SPRTYVTQTGTCQNAIHLGENVAVDSVAECQAKCDAHPECVAIDHHQMNERECKLKSHCEGTVGDCSGWCSYVAVLPNGLPTTSPSQGPTSVHPTTSHPTSVHPTTAHP